MPYEGRDFCPGFASQEPAVPVTAILDRVVHGAIRFELQGASMRAADTSDGSTT